MALKHAGLTGLCMLLHVIAQDSKDMCLQGSACSKKNTESLVFIQKRTIGGKSYIVENDDYKSEENTVDKTENEQRENWRGKDRVTVKITNLQHTEENIHDGPECSQDHDCLEACFEKFPYDLCWVQKEQFYCEGLEKGASGKCAVSHFMKNNSIFNDVKIDHAALLQGDAIQSEALQGEANKSKILMAKEDHIVYEEDCNECVCWGDSVKKCKDQVITDARKCGQNIVEDFVFGQCESAGDWWPLGCLLPTTTVSRTARQCSIGPCRVETSFEKCTARISDLAGDMAGKFMGCVTKDCDDFECVKSNIEKKTSCQVELLQNTLKDGSAALEAAGVPHAVSNLMTTLEDKLPIADSTKDFVEQLAKTIKDEVNNQENWEDGSMCTPKLPFLAPIDCGAFEKGRKIFEEMHRADKWLKETVDALKHCASKKSWGIPTPFMQIQTSGQKCLPKFFDKLKRRVQQGGPLAEQIVKIRDEIYGKEYDKIRELATSSSLLQSDGQQGRSKIVFKLDLQLRMSHKDVNITEGLDFGVGVAFHPSDRKVDFFVETAFIMGERSVAQVAKDIVNFPRSWEGVTFKKPRMAVVLAYAPGVSGSPSTAPENKPFDCWSEGPTCQLSPAQIVLGGRLPDVIMKQAMKKSFVDLKKVEPLAGTVLAADHDEATTGATYFSMVKPTSGKPDKEKKEDDEDKEDHPVAFVATKIPFKMMWTSWKSEARPCESQTGHRCGPKGHQGVCGVNRCCSPNGWCTGFTADCNDEFSNNHDQACTKASDTLKTGPCSGQCTVTGTYTWTRSTASENVAQFNDRGYVLSGLPTYLLGVTLFQGPCHHFENNQIDIQPSPGKTTTVYVMMSHGNAQNKREKVRALLGSSWNFVVEHNMGTTSFGIKGFDVLSKNTNVAIHITLDTHIEISIAMAR